MEASKTASAQSKKECDALRAQIAELNQQVQALDDDCEEYAKSEETMKAKIVALETSNSKLQQQMDAAYKAAQKVS